MPRQARLDAPGTLHHVMIRGIEGREIFRDDVDRRDFLVRTGTLAAETGTRIVAWALMTNHVHLLFFSGHQGISRFMRRLLTGYAGQYNRRHHRTGHLFQNRYKSIICEEETYLLELVRYIHLNPLRAGVVRNIEELNEYCWTGHSILIGKSRNDWQERDCVLGRFGKTQRKAIRAYQRFVGEGKDQGRRAELVGGGLVRSLGGWSKVISMRETQETIEHDSRILGGGDFATGILKEAGRYLQRQMPLNERRDLMGRVIADTCREAGIKEQELRMGGRRKRVSRIRAELAYRLSRELGTPAAEIARQLGVRTSAIIKAVQKVESERK